MYKKYPKTHHLPWSRGVSRDDKMLAKAEQFLRRRIIVSEKVDGECSSLYTDHIHARSVNSGYHPSRTWLKGFWSSIRLQIPTGWRICGETLFAKHSIHYTSLPTFFLGYSVWNEDNICLSWDETILWFEELGIEPVPIIFDGVVQTEDQLHCLWSDYDEEQHEGYVVRVADSFVYRDFTQMVGKYVRSGHIQTDQHWLTQPMVKNQLKNLL